MNDMMGKDQSIDRYTVGKVGECGRSICTSYVWMVWRLDLACKAVGVVRKKISCLKSTLTHS